MAEDQTWATFARVLSLLSGWGSFALWSLSFYPQVLLNIKRRSTKGLSVDFALANVLGLSAYTIYTATILFSSTIRQEYAERHPKSPNPSVRVNDFVYASHGLLLVLISYSQYYSRLWGFEVGASQQASKPLMAILIASIAAVVAMILIVASNESDQYDSEPYAWTWLDVMYAISDLKLFTTVIKYCPQCYVNYKRKSTKGFSISPFLLDFIGGVLSLLQLFLDATFDADWSAVTGNSAKFMLGNITLFFDLIIFFQHYLLYGTPKAQQLFQEEAQEEEPLIRSRSN